MMNNNEYKEKTIKEMMNSREYIRNISIIAHVDHGKTALTESLAHVTMDVGEEKDRGITIKSAAVSLTFSRKEEDEERQYLINLIDSPGHVDFNAEVSAALRITDGSICVVDCIDGVCVQTETVLRQSMLERVKPVLFLNKIDRIWLEKHLELMDTYRLFKNTIESINVITSTYIDKKGLGEIIIDPTTGNVGFGSGYFGYGFTLNDFVKIYSNKFAMKPKKLMKKLWGNNYWNSNTSKWQENTSGLNKNAVNGFCQFVLYPLQILHDSIMNEQSDIYEPIISTLGLNIKSKDISECAKPKDVLGLVMKSWLPAKNAVLDLCADHLPSPIKAQKYRIPNLYTGPLDTEEARYMKLCDPNGPLSMYVSKMIPTKDENRFIAFGRVFSGTVKRGQELLILDPKDEINTDQKYDGDDNNSSDKPQIKRKGNKKKVQGITVMMGHKSENVTSVPAGNICGLMGIDQQIRNTGTITNSLEIHPFKTMKLSVSAVVKVAVEVINPKDLNKLINGLKKLSSFDNVLKHTQNNQGQQIIAGAGELHLETCLNQLREKYMNNAPIKVGNPIVSFNESISDISGTTSILPTNVKSGWNYPKIMIAKSPNKLNRLYCSAQPISSSLCTSIENDEFIIRLSDMKAFSNKFIDKFGSDGWNKNDAQKIWTFGCEDGGKCNILVDQTRGVQHLDKIRSSVISGFKQATSAGILAQEEMRGIRYNLTDAKIHQEPTHHGPGQIIPSARRMCLAGQLSASPILLEPMYLVQIDVPMDSTNGVYNTLGKVRGIIDTVEDKSDIGISSCKMCAFVPIIETFKNPKEKKSGFMELLRENTKGKAFAVMKFSHWEIVQGNPLQNGSMSNKYIMDIRKRKGMKLENPVFSDYYDRI